MKDEPSLVHPVLVNALPSYFHNILIHMHRQLQRFVQLCSKSNQGIHLVLDQNGQKINQMLPEYFWNYRGKDKGKQQKHNDNLWLSNSEFVLL